MASVKCCSRALLVHISPTKFETPPPSPYYPSFQKYRRRNTRVPAVRMVSNEYISRRDDKYTNPNPPRIYKRLESCLVIPPPTGMKPKAIIKFLGGAFIGAVPEVTYRYINTAFILTFYKYF